MGTVDWNAAFDTAGKPEEVIPVSTYSAVIEGAEWKVSSKGNTMFVLRFSINDGGPFSGRALWHRITVNPGGSQYGLQRSLEQLKDLGLTQAVLTSTDEKTQGEMVVGVLANITTKMDSYKGKPQAAIDHFEVVGEGGSGVAPPPALAQTAPQAAPPVAAPPVVDPAVAPPAAAPVPEAAPPVTPPPAPFGG